VPSRSVALGVDASLRMIQPLGIGLPYIASLPAELYDPALLDFVEITPETLCRERRNGGIRALELIPDELARARQTCGALPIVVHGVELSIGSAHGCNTAYLDMLDAFQASWPFTWHSEHLGFQTIPGDDGSTLEVGVPLPQPATEESVRLIAARSAAIRRRYGVPFLLENPAYYLSGLPADPEIGEDGGLMRAITERSGCFQLLDLHNVYCNAVNQHIDSLAAIGSMPLSRVVEIHVAGGSWQQGFWMDAHDSRVPEGVWDLLEQVLPRTPNVAGVVFEVLEEYAVVLGAAVIAKELMTARDIWRRRGCR
jgi:uncharacterized protein (UPF0276 family)